MESPDDYENKANYDGGKDGGQENDPTINITLDDLIDLEDALDGHEGDKDAEDILFDLLQDEEGDDNTEE